MAVACAVSVANLYYCQPLLADMGASLGVGARRIGYLPMWTQAGTALGMFAFVPLGDMLPRRRLIVTMCLAIGLAAALMAMAPGIAMVNVAGFAIGLTTIVPHLVLPFAAKLAPAERRGHVVGTVLGGLLIGILLARVVSGYVGDALGWRAMYWMAAASMAALALALRFLLPVDTPDLHLNRSSYPEGA
jgi:predicted MFS family arabinose efflux permease